MRWNEMVKSVRNCPNCGAVVHDCVCDYCGSVFPSSANDIIGKRCMLVVVDDSDQIRIMGLNVRSIVQKLPERYYTDTKSYFVGGFAEVDEVEVTGTVDTTQVTAHGLRRLKDIFINRLGDF